MRFVLVAISIFAVSAFQSGNHGAMDFSSHGENADFLVSGDSPQSKLEELKKRKQASKRVDEILGTEEKKEMAEAAPAAKSNPKSNEVYR